MFRAVRLYIIRSLFTVHSTMVYVTQVCRQLSIRTRIPSRSCSKAIYKPVWRIPLLSVQWINSWWWTDELSETCRVSCQNKFVKLVHLVGFIIKKSDYDGNKCMENLYTVCCERQYRTVCCERQYPTVCCERQYRTVCYERQYPTVCCERQYRTVCCERQFRTVCSERQYRTVCSERQYRTVCCERQYRTVCCERQYRTVCSERQYRTVCSERQYRTNATALQTWAAVLL
jgi:hypothetical protein